METSYLGMDALSPSLFLCSILSLLSTFHLSVTFAKAQEDTRCLCDVTAPHTVASSQGHSTGELPLLPKVTGIGVQKPLSWPLWETE